MPIPGKSHPEKLCCFKLRIRNDNQFRDRWRNAARTWHRSLLISGKRTADDGIPGGGHVVAVEFILPRETATGSANPTSLTNLMRGRVRLFGDFQTAQGAAMGGRAYIETDPAQVTMVDKKQYRLNGWLVEVDRSGGTKVSE